MNLPRIITEDLGGSPLAIAARSHEPPVWYRARPAGADEWRQHAIATAHDFAGGSWLKRLAPAFHASGAAAARLERTASAGGVVVTTGQQPALFGGPAYNLSKALSVLALADLLESEIGIPVAPVFWAATDDADFDEARSVSVSIPGGVARLDLAQRPPAGTPLSQAPLENVTSLLAQLRVASGSVVDPGPLDAVEAAYRASAGATIGSAYVALLRAILEPLGIAVLDASHAAVRTAAAPVLERALERASDLEEAQRTRAAEIVSAGYAAQVEHVPGLSLVFSTHSGERARIPVAEAERAIHDTPVSELGPNVLLRPVIERAILPTVTYVGGPGETAYFAQVSAVAEVLDAAVPIVSPRWSMTVLEPRVAAILTDLGLDREDLSKPDGVEGELARAALPRDVQSTLSSLRTNIEHGVGELAVADDQSLVPTESLEAFQRWVLHRLQRLERRFVAGVKRAEVELMRDVATARGSLYPAGVRQERALSFIPWLARYGPALLDEMRTQASAHARTILGSAAREETAEAEPARGPG